MVIHNEDEAPTEVKTVMQVTFDQYSHLSSTMTNKTNIRGSKMTNRSKSTEEPDVSLKRNVMKPKNKSRTINQSSASPSTDLEDNSSATMKISENDLIQLKTVYKQCKSVMRKMKLKYGHLLDSGSSDSDEGPSVKRNRLDNLKQVCQCTFNKKIVFDDDGLEVAVNTSQTLPSNHICPTKLTMKNYLVDTTNRHRNIEVEYHSTNELSDNIQDLRHILQDPTIETTYRNRVIEKLKLIKQEHWNDIKFNKLSLVESLKANPNEVVSFEGSNLSVLSGYYGY